MASDSKATSKKTKAHGDLPPEKHKKLDDVKDEDDDEEENEREDDGEEEGEEDEGEEDEGDEDEDEGEAANTEGDPAYKDWPDTLQFYALRSPEDYEEDELCCNCFVAHKWDEAMAKYKAATNKEEKKDAQGMGEASAFDVNVLLNKVPKNPTKEQKKLLSRLNQFKERKVCMLTVSSVKSPRALRVDVCERDEFRGSVFGSIGRWEWLEACEPIPQARAKAFQQFLVSLYSGDEPETHDCDSDYDPCFVDESDDELANPATK